MSDEAIYHRDPADKDTSVTARIARLRQSLSGDKLAGLAATKAGGLAGRAREAAEAAGLADGAGYADLGGERQLNGVEAAERAMDRRNDRKARTSDRRGPVATVVRDKRGAVVREETKAEEIRSSNGLYVSMDDGLPPPEKEVGLDRFRRQSTQLFRRGLAATKKAAARLSARSGADAVDGDDCSGAGTKDAALYVDRAHLDQFDRTPEAASLSQIAAAASLSTASAHSGGLWALKARYIATQRVIPGKLAAAQKAEVRATQLAETLNEATDKCDALQHEEARLQALLAQAARLDAARPARAPPSVVGHANPTA